MYKQLTKPKNIIKIILTIIALWLISSTLYTTFSSYAELDHSDEGRYDLQYETIEVADEIIEIDFESSAEYDMLFADSAEDLGFEPQASMTVISHSDLSLYNLESEHFIFDELLWPYLSGNITPEIFNLFMDRMDQGYEAMLDLVGIAPHNGSKITISRGGEYGSNWAQWVWGHRPHIYWNQDLVGQILYNINRQGANCWWFEGTMHELGHIFQHGADNTWNFFVEGSASYIAWIAVERAGGTFMIGNRTVSGAEQIAHRQGELESRYGFSDTNRQFNVFDPSWQQDSIIFFLNPIFETEQGWDRGWDVLRQAFRSYLDPDFPTNSHLGNRYQQMARDFFDRISHFLGEDITEVWTAATYFRYRENFYIENNDNSPVIVRINPREPRVGDELMVSIYNVRNAVSVPLWLLRSNGYWDWGGGERFSQGRMITLEPGNNVISTGYIITASDISETFDVLVWGEIDVWAEQRTAPVQENTNIDVEINGERFINGHWYFYINGVRQTGWQNFDWRWLYYDDNGRMVYGMREIDGVWYYFNHGHGGLIYRWNWNRQRWISVNRP